MVSMADANAILWHAYGPPMRDAVWDGILSYLRGIPERARAREWLDSLAPKELADALERYAGGEMRHRLEPYRDIARPWNDPPAPAPTGTPSVPLVHDDRPDRTFITTWPW